SYSLTVQNGFSPLYVASYNGHSDVVEILLEAGADVHQATTKDGSVPLGIAAQEGHTETVQRLLEAGAIVNHQNKAGTTALLFAGWKGHSELVKLLLGAGARDIPDKFGETALSLARANNHNDVACSIYCNTSQSEK
ncbi:Ankyrin repeat domain-containing protein 29, partial [Geodia barretti]